MRNNFQIWVDAVCGQVRFWPDQKAIARELRVHYEDHVKDLLRLGRSQELAEERALAAMGDAQEVGRALDKVHKPWLGWLWEVSRCMVLGLAVMALVAAFAINSLPNILRGIQGELAWETPPATAARVELEHATLWAAPEEITKREGQTVAAVRLWIQMHSPMQTNAGVGTWYFTWRDEEGELPLRKFDSIHQAYVPERRYWQFGESPDAVSSDGWIRFQRTVELVLDEPPQWVEISYPLSGQDWAMLLTWEVTP